MNTASARISKYLRHCRTALFGMLISCPQTSAMAQVVFPLENCEFQVFFLDKPRISDASVQDIPGRLIKSDIADWSVDIRSVLHYFRAECIHLEGAKEKYKDDDKLTDAMSAIAAGQGLKAPQVFVQNLPEIGKVGVVRAEMIARRNVVLTMEIRRYIGDKDVFDLYAAAEKTAFPTQNVEMFMRSLS